MRNELFGVFGDRADFEHAADERRFDRVVETPRATVGVRDLGYGLPNRTAVYETDGGAAVVWGEVVSETGGSTAERLYRRVGEVGRDAFSELNGSYLAFVDRVDDGDQDRVDDGERDENGRDDTAGKRSAGDGVDDALLVTDPIRSRECFYTDAADVRTFGTDAARVAKTIPDTTVDRRTVVEVTHFGVAFGDDTAFSELKRVPFDGYLAPASTGELRRFVYDPQPPEAFDAGDYADELAERLKRAVRRRVGMPGRTGLLLSAGYDARLLLSQSPDVDVGYTPGDPGSSEVRVAARLADQYGVDHERLDTTSRRLDRRPEVLQYTQGVRESLHAHHGGCGAVEADSMLHGLLFGQLFRGSFLPERRLNLLGHTLPRSGLDPDPDVPRHVAEELGGLGEPDALADCECLSASSATAFTREVVEPAFEAGFDRADGPHNAIDLLGMKLKPTLARRDHLADDYVESFVAADAELLDWHLKTPPEHRNDETWLQALRRLDPELLRHSPPDRPHRSARLNAVERVVRETLPLVPSLDPRPDPGELYDRGDLDRKLFPGYDEVYGLPPRVKLRMNDLTTWLEFATGEPRCTPDELLGPPAGGRTAAPRTDGGRPSGDDDDPHDASEGFERRTDETEANGPARGQTGPRGPTGPTGPPGPPGPPGPTG